MEGYTSKPVQVQAVQFIKENYEEFISLGIPIQPSGDGGDCFVVTTLEGVMTGREGDWLIKGIEGELYPCKDSVFQKKYVGTNVKHWANYWRF